MQMNEKDSSAGSVAVNLSHELKLLSKRARLIKQELLYKVDSWGKQLPIRLFAQCSDYLGAKDLASCSSVCSSWKLPLMLENRLWQHLYMADYEAETAQELFIANGGA